MNFNLSKNKLFIIGGALIAVIAVVLCIILFTGNDTNNQIEEVVIEESQEEIVKKELYSAINQGVQIGSSKQSIIDKFKPTEDGIGKNYVVSPNYTRIGKYDFLTAFIFSEDALVAIVHERVLDGTQKHNLSVEFQKFTSDIGELYTLVETGEDWFTTELVYDANTWNSAITNNDLELYSSFENEETKEYIRMIASGINYFDFLANDREMLSVGNLNLIYTSSVYKENFLGFVSLASEQ